MAISIYHSACGHSFKHSSKHVTTAEAARVAALGESSRAYKCPNCQVVFIAVVPRWSSDVPQRCDICKRDLTKAASFVDGLYQGGGWAIMCCYCHQTKGVGFGTGRGQKYEVKTRLKIDG